MVSIHAPKLVPLREAAERVGLHRATLNEMVRDGRLEAVRVGPYWYLAADVLEAFARSYQRPKNAPSRERRRPQPSAELLALLADWEDATVGELAVVMHLHEGNIRKHLALADAEGLARRDQLGRWHLTPAGRRRATRAHNAHTADG